MLKGTIGTSTAALVMIFIMLPFFLLAMYERNGQPLEKVVGNHDNRDVCPPKTASVQNEKLLCLPYEAEEIIRGGAKKS